MSKSEIEVKAKRKPLVTEPIKRTNPGFINPCKGIEVAPGLTFQDVPLQLRKAHMRQTENFWKEKFKNKYAHTHGGNQSF